MKNYNNFTLELMFKNEYLVVFKDLYFYHKKCCQVGKIEDFNDLFLIIDYFKYKRTSFFRVCGFFCNYVEKNEVCLVSCLNHALLIFFVSSLTEGKLESV